MEHGGGGLTRLENVLNGGYHRIVKNAGAFVLRLLLESYPDFSRRLLNFEMTSRSSWLTALLYKIHNKLTFAVADPLP